MDARRPLTAALLLIGALACMPDDQRTDTLDPHEGMGERQDMAPEVVVQLDSGSAAFRNDDFERALTHYTRVTELDPENGPGWFGVYMAEDALGRPDQAQAALNRARTLVPGGTLLHPDETPR
jgi:tetratricopeptide (TPR) repeat protein